MADEMLETYDFNHDGKCDASELIPQVLMLIDKNSDGGVTRDEFLAFTAKTKASYETPN